MRILELAVALAACAGAADAVADSRQALSTAARQGGLPLGTARALAGAEVSLTCFNDSLTELVNPGCWDAQSPDICASHAGHYFVQFLTPNFATPHRVAGFGFISNDQSTVFPRAGVVLIPVAENRYPTPAELAALQVQDVPTPHDTSIVIVDLRDLDPPLLVTAGTDVMICLGFPEGGQLTAVGVGPGILIDSDAPDLPCDALTLDAGSTYLTNVPADPVDWGFEVIFEPISAVEPRSWSEVKRLFGAPLPVLLNRDP